MIVWVLILLGSNPQAPIPPQAPSLERRIQVLEENHNNFEARLAALEGKTKTTKPTKATTTDIVVPPGQHAHRTTDGRIIVHSDSNFGDPVAHAGVAYPWPKVAVSGQVVRSSSCPDGVSCPVSTGVTGVRYSYATPVTYSNNNTSEVKVKRGFGSGLKLGKKKCKNGVCPL